MKAMLDDPVKYSASGRGPSEYWLGEAPARGGGTHAVALVRAGMGNNIASARATLLLSHFPNINVILMVGIAGGVPYPEKPEHHVRLGDIVVSGEQGVVQTDFVKQETGRAPEQRHPPRPPSPRLLDAVAELEALEFEHEFPWLMHIERAQHLKNSRRPPESTAALASGRHPKDERRIAGQPRVFKAPISSANKLLKDAAERDRIREFFGVKAVEMETSGIADATWLHEVGYLAVRGICDYCDFKKGDRWQMYAAIIAAAYARAVLEHMPLRQRAPAEDEGFAQGGSQTEFISKPKGAILFEGPGAVPALKVPHFIGRNEEMQVLRDVFVSNAEVVCVVTTGLGGTGKTALVQQFVATEAQALFPEGVAWLDGTELIRELARVANRFGLHIDQSTPPEEISRQLCQELHHRRILLVVDNVDRGKNQLPLIPIPGGLCRTVLTSRTSSLHADLGKLSEPLYLRSWSTEACRSYFRTAAPVLQKSPDWQLDALSAFVGGLPLAIKLLSKSLLKPGNTPERLLARLKREPMHTLDLAAQGADRSIIATFMVALQDLSQEHLRVLIATAACARSTRDSVVASVAGLDEDAIISALIELADRSFVDYIQGAERPWSMHDIVRLLARLHPAFHQFAMPRHGLYVREQGMAFDRIVRQRVTSETLRTGSPRVDAEKEAPEFLAAIDNFIATGNGRLALMMLEPAAEFLLGRIPYAVLKVRIEETIQLFPSGSPETTGLLGLLGQCCFQLGDVQVAIKHLNLAVELAKTHSLLQEEAHAHGHLGYCFRMLGDLPRGIQHLEQTLQIAERIGNFAEQSVALTGLANCYRTLHDLPKALETLERALAIAQRLDDPRAETNAWLHIGNCHAEQDKIQQAIEAYERVVSMPNAFDMTTMVAALAGLAACHGKLGNIAKAKDFNERALEFNQNLGRADGQAVTLLNRGILLGPTQSHQEEIEDLERALAISEKLGSPERQAEVLSRLSDVYAEIEQVEAAIQYEERALATLEKLDIPKPQCESLIKLGRYHLEGGNEKEGLRYYDKAQRLSEKHQVPICQAAALQEIGEHFLSKDDLPRATSNFERALTVYEVTSNAEGKSHVLKCLVVCANESKDFRRAGMYLEQLLPIAQKEGTAAEILADLGMLKQQLGELPEAVDYLRRSLALLDDIHPEKKFKVLVALAGCCYLMRHFTDAIASLSDALELSARLQDKAEQAVCLSALGDCYYESGEASKAQAMYLRFLSLGEDATHPRSQANTLLQLARCCLQLGETSEALAYAERALALGKQHEDNAGQASAYNVIGACHLAGKRPEDAIVPLECAWNLERKLGREVEKAHVLANIGLCHRELGDTSKAIEHLERAVDCFHRAGDFSSEQQLLSILRQLRQQA